MNLNAPAAAVEKRAGDRAAEPGGHFVSRGLSVKAVDAERRFADFVASTDVVDAHDEIVDQGTWRLDDYLKNPVVLFAHESCELPIGRCADVSVSGGQLTCRIEFASAEMNPLAEQVWRMVQGKFLRAVSVGFIPMSGRYELRDGDEVWIWSDCVLKEISVTPIGANPEALAKMKSAFSRGDVPYRSERRAAPGPADTGPALPGETQQPEHEQRSDDMNFEQMAKDLQAKIEKMTSEHAATVAELRLEARTKADGAEKADAALKDARAHAEKLQTEHKALGEQNAKLATERDEAAKRADAADSKLVEIEVEAEVGKKISPAEKETFVALRRANPDLYAKMIEQRQPLGLLGKGVIAGKDEEKGVPTTKMGPEGKNGKGGGSAGDDLLSVLGETAAAAPPAKA